MPALELVPQQHADRLQCQGTAAPVGQPPRSYFASDVSSIGSVANRKEMPSDLRCDPSASVVLELAHRSPSGQRWVAREPREVEHNNEVDSALVRPAVCEEPLQLRTVGRLGAFAFFSEPLENLNEGPLGHV